MVLILSTLEGCKAESTSTSDCNSISRSGCSALHGMNLNYYLILLHYYYITLLLLLNYYCCYYYNNICKTLLDDLQVINVNILKLSETALTDLLLYGEASFNKIQNKMILTASNKFIVDSDSLLVLFF